MRKVLVLLIVSIQVFAIDAFELMEKSRRVDRLIQHQAYDLSQTQINQTARLLSQIRRVLRSRGGGGDYNPQECRDYVFEIYKRNYNSSTAYEKAARLCKNYVYMDALKYFYEKGSRNLSHSSAIEFAVRYATQDSIGQMPKIKLLVQTYEKNYSSRSAAERAGRNIHRLRNTTLECLDKGIIRYSRNYSSSAAADKAIDFCEEYGE